MVSIENIKPLGDRVIVRPVSKETATESGIIIPDTAAKDKPEQGEVLAVGPGEINEKGERVPMELKVGQIVMFTKYSPNEIEVEGEDLLVIKQKDVLAIIASDNGNNS
ncbi:co-chaperone GroES [candidate division WWE3 bacterium]|uniref:Co-chaperonin GroES n=1 Tax=candidate division WWE3 bacterium TaxID=2053526 RepID=A0A955LJZ2_UNCKA|nr:co-chaperone GroES [candidate division WWE3 bacterium]